MKIIMRVADGKTTTEVNGLVHSGTNQDIRFRTPGGEEVILRIRSERGRGYAFSVEIPHVPGSVDIATIPMLKEPLGHVTLLRATDDYEPEWKKLPV